MLIASKNYGLILPEHFKFHVSELVCNHTYSRFGEKAWMFIPQASIDFLHWFRTSIKRPIIINNYNAIRPGNETQSGLRCAACPLVMNKAKKGIPYMTAHLEGRAWDPRVIGMTTKEVHRWFEENIEKIPCNIRLEKDVPHIHVDLYTGLNETERIVYFSPKTT